MLPKSRFNSSDECFELFGQLSALTLSQGDTDFIHQLAVDSYEAQHSGGITKDITTAYGLIGLCLAVEHNYTGRQVQNVHMNLLKQIWPKLNPPKVTGTMTVLDVLRARSISQREKFLNEWAKSVWESWIEYHDWVRQIVMEAIYH